MAKLPWWMRHPKKALKGAGKGVGKAVSKATGGIETAIKGTPAQEVEMDIFDPDQLEFLQQALSQATEQFQQPEFDFDPIEQQARTKFQEETIPSIAERFTAMGGGQRSSGFQQALGKAGSGLEERLASLRSMLEMQQQQQKRGFGAQLAGYGLTPRHHMQIMPAQPGLAQQGTSALAQYLPMLLGLL